MIINCFVLDFRGLASPWSAQKISDLHGAEIFHKALDREGRPIAIRGTLDNWSEVNSQMWGKGSLNRWQCGNLKCDIVRRPTRKCFIGFQNNGHTTRNYICLVINFFFSLILWKHSAELYSATFERIISKPESLGVSVMKIFNFIEINFGSVGSIWYLIALFGEPSRVNFWWCFACPTKQMKNSQLVMGLGEHKNIFPRSHQRESIRDSRIEALGSMNFIFQFATL